jgi:hypothetical protein
LKLQVTNRFELCFTDLHSTDVTTVGHKVMVDGRLNELNFNVDGRPNSLKKN